MKTKLFSLILIATLLPIFLEAAPLEDYVAHEWGTFTSVQGPDGIQLEWNPLITTELPGFVYDASKPSGSPRRHLALSGPKSGFRTLQRMETPVIYFYSAKERTVDVTVRFPQGLITEWFPQAREIGPSWVEPRPALAKLDQLADQAGLHSNFNFSSLDTRKGVSESIIRWADVNILPSKDEARWANLIPVDQSGSHYYAARGTDADLLRVHGTVNGANTVEHEKFLFYRGIGNFQTPLEVTLGSNEDYLQLHNRGTEEMAHIFVLDVRRGRGELLFVERLGAGGDTMVKLDPNARPLPMRELIAQISARMQDTLAAQGLYAREATAMVQTWQDSWFGEPGLRVLYLLPRKWTDQVLPLTLTPAPKEVVRVMVGRAEVITPTMEWQVLKQIVKFSESDEAGRTSVVAETRHLGLGRFAEPTVRRILGKSPSREFSQQAWNLLNATKPQARDAKGLAVR